MIYEIEQEKPHGFGRGYDRRLFRIANFEYLDSGYSVGIYSLVIILSSEQL